MKEKIDNIIIIFKDKVDKNSTVVQILEIQVIDKMLQQFY